MLKFISILFFFVSTTFATEYGKVESRKIADDVYLFTTTPYGVGLSGNSIVILSGDGVFVFDTNGLPQTAETILKEIRKLSEKPVRYVVNSHWHWDHWAGNQVYREEFPAVKIITHEKTLEQMLQVEPRWNDQGLKVGLPGYLKELEQQLEKAKTDKKPEAEIKEREELVNAARNFLAQKTSLKKTYPDVTFSSFMTIQPGGREIQIRHARAITVGDTYVYLPKEKILITGDALLSPYPYAIGGAYPADWLKTLEEFEALKPAIIIPGHGEPQTLDFLQQNIRLFRTILQGVKESRTSGSTVDQTKVTIGQRSKELASVLGISDEQMTAEFKAYFLDVFVTRAYRELDGPLSDLPDGL